MKSTSLVVLALIAASSRPASGAPFYVDGANPVCSDAGPGTADLPYCSITAAVLAHGAPGNTINVRPATYREQVTVPISGIAGSPLVIRAEGGSPILEGADDFSTTAAWTPYAGDVWLAAAVTWKPNQVRVDSTRLDTLGVDPATLPARTYRYVAGAGLYVNVGGGNPGARRILVGRRVNGFRLTGRSYVTIDGFTLLRSDDKGIQVTGPCSDVMILNNQISLAAKHGISLSNVTAATVSGNRTFDNGDHGIHCLTGVMGSTLSDNESFRNVRPKTRAANGINLFASTGNRIERNRLHDNQDTGVDLSGGSNDNRMIQNRSWRNGDHGFDDLNSSGGSHVGDVAWGNFKDGFSVEGQSPNTSLFDCIAIENGLTSGEFDLYVDFGAVAGFASNDNLFWNSTSQVPIHHNGFSYSTVAGFAAATGLDTRTIQADPLLADPTAGNFRPRPGSRAIDSGNSGVANWPSTDADGRARVDDPSAANSGIGPIAFADRGALEADVNTAPVLVVPAQVTVAENQTVSFQVTAADADGEGIAFLTADLSRLPAGDASFAVAAATAGTLTWHPTYADAGSYVVTFRAANTQADVESTLIVVSNVDRAPVLIAPATVNVRTNTLITITVTASDPDGNPITTLTANLSQLSGATFTVNATRTSGVLTWNTGQRNNRNYKVTFTAKNALSTSGVTRIRVQDSGALAQAQTEAADSLAGDGVGGKPLDGSASLGRLSLSSVHPNPGRGAVEALLTLPSASRVAWTVHDLQGRELHAETGVLQAGRWRLSWDGASDRDPAPPGIYLLSAAVGDRRLTRRFVLLPR